jgi:hypothetical protein
MISARVQMVTAAMWTAMRALTPWRAKPAPARSAARVRIRAGATGAMRVVIDGCRRTMRRPLTAMTAPNVRAEWPWAAIQAERVAVLWNMRSATTVVKRRKRTKVRSLRTWARPTGSPASSAARVGRVSGTRARMTRP